MKKNKVLITGGTGFIGSHLCEFLTKKGYQVICFDRYNTDGNLNNLENSKYIKDIEFIFGDIRDYDSVNKASKNCSSVIHLAALIGIPYSYVSPLAYIKTNVEGTYNVLESSKNLNIKNIIITSTSEVYGTAQYVPMDENHPLVGQSPYSASKIAADQISLSYFKSFSTPIKIIRPFNTYGPRQSLRAVVPTIISQYLSKSKNINIGTINSKRDFTYVSDLCNAYYLILKSKNFFGEVHNIGSGKEISVGDIIKKVEKITLINKELKLKKNRKRPNKSEVMRLLCNNKKITKNYKWKPKVNFESGLTETIKWYKDLNKDSKNKYLI